MEDDTPPPVDPKTLPPRKLSSKIGHANYRPDAGRVGLKIDGIERNDIRFYDMDSNVYETTAGDLKVGEIEPYWRYAESRQMRRARERWEGKNRG